MIEIFTLIIKLWINEGILFRIFATNAKNQLKIPLCLNQKHIGQNGK